MSVVATRVSVPAYPLLVRDSAQSFVLAEVESTLGRLDGRREGMPPTRDAMALLGRVLAAHVLRAVSTSSERPRLSTLLGLRPEDDALAESLDAAWLAATPSQALKDELERIGESYGDYLRSLKLAAAGTSGHGQRILSRFPAFMRADRRGKALGELAHALGRDLDEADRLLLEIRDAHALAAAKEEGDVLKLASALGFERADFLVLAKLKDKGFYATDDAAGADAYDRAEIAYRHYLTDLKQAVGRFARICLRGCGTVPALLEGTMVLLNGDPRDAAGSVQRVGCGGVFVFIGADAETGWLPEAIARDERGYILTGDAAARSGRWQQQRDPYLLESSVPGIFACGDVRSSLVKRAAAAVGEGSMAIAFVHQFLARIGHA